MKNSLLLICLLSAFCFSLAAQTKDFTRWVNPFIGTGGHGHTFPGAVMPFGMVALSPDTRIDNWDGSGGYHYSDDIIYGFSHTHLSGTGIPDGCDILFMPTIGEPKFFAKDGDKTVNGYASKFSHANEKAEPGYYSVMLDDDGILAEMTATARVGFHRYTFPKTDKANIILDLKWRDKLLDSELKIVESNVAVGSRYGKPGEKDRVVHFTRASGKRIEGYRRSSSWAKDQVVYFAAEFSQPFADHTYDPRGFGVSPGTPGPNPYQNVMFRFGIPKANQILLKVAISYVSIEGARKNLEAEIPGWDFDKVRADAKAAWNKELSKIEVSGGTDDQTTNFYTALYHTMIHPSIFNDVDGKYKGHDGKIHLVDYRTSYPTIGLPNGEVSVPPADASPYYTVFSLWDTFRAAHPLYTIIDEKRTVDFINSFIRMYEQGGRLPVWELWGEETDTMIGYHAVSVIADAMAKGIKGFDYEKAYEAAKHSAELDHFGLAAYKRRGYISMEDENESVSRTLEYAYNDWCIAQMQAILARNRNFEALPPVFQDGDFRQRARYFENIFDTKTGFFRAKKNGGFVEPFSPTEVNFGFTEGNSWQYSFFVPHDVTRLMELMGGREKFVAKLDELFTTTDKLSGREQADLTGLIGQYAHGNEPSHHIAYLYNYAGEPWKTQKYVRYIMDNFYNNAPDGLIGNEDAGQMSAWYILSASGFYPIAPGSTQYALGTPLFPEVKFNLENGKTFVIKRQNPAATVTFLSGSKGITLTSTKGERIYPDGADPAFYIKSARLNGKEYKKAYIKHEDLMKGGVLEFAMSDTPVTTAFTEFPVSKINVATLPVPALRFGNLTDEGTKVFFDRINPMDVVFYSTDGTDPFNSKTGIVNMDVPTLKESTRLKVVGYDPDRKIRSKVVEANYMKKPNNWTVRVLSGYSTQYTGGGDDAIVDGIRGTVNFASGEWQGIQGKPYEAVIDLKRETEIRELGASFLQVAGPWIWMPARIKFEISDNGTEWRETADIKTDVPLTEMKPTLKEFRQKISPVRARYVRIRAFNIGKIPSWHLGAGGQPWIFVDEIIVE